MVRSTYLHVLRVAGSLVLCAGCGARSGLPESEGAGGARGAASTSGVLTVSAGGNHACAVTSTGSVVCWGQNTYGQLGTGSATSSLVPVEMTGL